MVASLALWGCGGGGGGGTGGAAGHGTGGANGGHAGATTGGGGHAGATATGGGGGQAAGTGGIGGAVLGTGGTATGGIGGGSATGGIGGGSATGGIGGSATGGTGGAASCTNGTACTTSGNVHGVCTSGTCQGCTADASCTASTAYGAGYICLIGTGNCVQGTCHDNGDCGGKICGTGHTCASCTTKNDCTTAYGNGYICQTSSGKCVQGSCNTAADCGAGQICSSLACTGCGTDDSACVTAYGNGYICVAGACVTGTCHNGAQCTGGKACSLANHTCGDCASDTDCQNSYGTGYICGSSNSCIAGNCRTDANCNGQLCVNNACTPCTTDGQCTSGKVCIGGSCITGNCHDKSNCPAGQICASNNCSSCTNDGQCIDAYGVYVCQGGSCKPGNCHLTGDCDSTSQICNTATLFCGACTTDMQCKTEYGGGTKQLCISNICVTGVCHDSSGCNGQICGTSHTCAACAADSDCQNDSKYGSGFVCQGGTCQAGNCHKAADCHDTTKICSSLQCTGCTTNTDCSDAYGNNHVCAGGACTSGNCATSADCGGTGQVCVGNVCVACGSDAQCMGDTVYGSMHICENGQCISGTCHTSKDCKSTKQLCDNGTHSCVACASDTACQSDGNYGTGNICLGMQCQPGDCHDTSKDCKNGQICGVTTAHTCGACTADNQCTADLTAYGPADICFQSGCVAGNCHATSADCTGTNAGRICAAENCGSCTNDAQCQADPFYGTSTICNTTAGSNAGKCVSASCSTNDTACGANSGDFCCSGTCVAGNCCNNNDCLNNPSFGTGYACIGNTCSHCDSITGNTYYVDPVNGNDVSATGSGKSGGTSNSACAFKTITHAMAVIGSFAGAGTKLVILGSSGSTTNLNVGETYPLTIQPNVTVTNSGGPVTVLLPAATNQANPANVSGFNLTSNGSGISGSTDPSAPLVLEGSGTSGIAVTVAGASTVATLANVTIQNTRAHAITVTGGTLNIGAGLVEKNAGTQSGGAAVISRDGLNITAGVVNITVPAGGSTTEFLNNSQRGISVTNTGSLNVSGAATTSPAPNGNGTVVTTLNLGSGLLIQQSVTTAVSTCSINGLVAYENNQYGAWIFGGSKVKLRNSVFAGNTNYGVVLSNNGTSTTGLDMSNFDFGTAAATDPGNNWFQMPHNTLGYNQSGGVCVSWGNHMAGGQLNAAGNEWNQGPIGNVNQQSQVNCATTAATITKQANTACGAGASYGKGTADTVTLVLDMCN